jgi:hypothetical protein
VGDAECNTLVWRGGELVSLMYIKKYQLWPHGNLTCALSIYLTAG